MATNKRTTDADNAAKAAAQAEAAERRAAAAAERAAAADICNQVSEATGWKVTADAMSLACTRDGYAPYIVHRSTLSESAEVAIAQLTDAHFVPLRLTVIERAAAGDTEPTADAGLDQAA